MALSPRLHLRRTVPLALVASLTLAFAACGAESDQRADEPAESTTTTVAASPPDPNADVREVWAPDGAPPPVVLNSPGDGGTISVRVGDRVQIPESEDFGGIVIDDHRRGDLLVPYGDANAFLAIAPGELEVEDTVYDPKRSCVPPQPVAAFTLVIADGPRPDIGEPVAVTAADEGTTIELVPGQVLTHDPDLILSVEEGGSEVLVPGDGRGHALRPGTVTVNLSTVRSPKQGDWISFTVVVTDPGGSQSSLRSAPAEFDAPAPFDAPTIRSCGG